MANATQPTDVAVAEPIDAGGRSTDRWKRITKPYCGADNRRSAFQLTCAATGFFLCWGAMFWSLHIHYALTLLLAVPTAGFLLFLFMIQHDCGHGSYFHSRPLRDAVGFFIGVLTLTPYEYWRKTHAYHHSHSGDLDFRGFGDIQTLTLKEYLALSKKERFNYRLYRNPVLLLTIGAAFHFLIKHRYPWDIPRTWKAAWTGVWWTNLAIASIVGIMTFTIGLKAFLLVQIPVTLLACAMGVWLFYVQHQYEESYWHNHDNWDYFDAALQGSSYLVLPKPLQWITANIGIHHVHHVNSQIPNYKLNECMDKNPELQAVKKVTIRESWHLFLLTLYDEEEKRMITFREMRRKLAQASA